MEYDDVSEQQLNGFDEARGYSMLLNDVNALDPISDDAIDSVNAMLYGNQTGQADSETPGDASNPIDLD